MIVTIESRGYPWCQTEISCDGVFNVDGRAPLVIRTGAAGLQTYATREELRALGQMLLDASGMASRGDWLIDRLTERTTPDGRTVLEISEEPIWCKPDGTRADYVAAVDAAMCADESRAEMREAA